MGLVVTIQWGTLLSHTHSVRGGNTLQRNYIFNSVTFEMLPRLHERKRTSAVV